MAKPNSEIATFSLLYSLRNLTDFSVVSEQNLYADDEKIGTQTMQSCFVDLKTRKLANLPKSFIDRQDIHTLTKKKNEIDTSNFITPEFEKIGQTSR